MKLSGVSRPAMETWIASSRCNVFVWSFLCGCSTPSYLQAKANKREQSNLSFWVKRSAKEDGKTSFRVPRWLPANKPPSETTQPHAGYQPTSHRARPLTRCHRARPLTPEATRLFVRLLVQPSPTPMHTVDTPVDTPPQTQLSCHPRLNRSFQSCHVWPPAGNRRGGLPARCQEQAKSNAQSKGFLLSVALPARCQEQAKTRSLSVALPARCQEQAKSNVQSKGFLLSIALPARCQEQAKTRSLSVALPARCQEQAKTRSQRTFCSPSLCQQGVKATCCQQGVNKPQKRVVLPVRWCQATKGVEQPGTFYSPSCCQQGVNKSSSREPSTLRRVASKASTSSHFHTFAAGSPTRKLKVSALLAASLLST